jgi:hypothetical protein
MKEIDHRPSERTPGFWQQSQEIGRFHTNGETYELFLRSRTIPGPGRKPSFYMAQAYIVEPRPAIPEKVRRLMPPSYDPHEGDRLRVGDVHALYSQENGQIDIVSCLLLPQYQEAEPKLDANFRGLWRGVEDALEGQFPDARVITTSVQDRHYDRFDYADFLNSMGYLPTVPNLRTYVRPL